MIVNCPRCGKSLEVNAPKDGTKFSCPECNKTLRFKAPVKPSASAPSQPAQPRPAEPPQPPPIHVPQPNASPQSPAQPAAPQAQPEIAEQSRLAIQPATSNSTVQQNRGRKNRNCLFVLISGGVATLSFGCVIGIVMLAMVKPDVVSTLDSIGDQVGFSVDFSSASDPSPEGIMGDLIDVFEEYDEVVNSVKDEASANQAATKIDRLTEQCHEFTVRGIPLGPLTDQQYMAVKEYAKARRKSLQEKQSERSEDSKPKTSDETFDREKLMESVAKFHTAFNNSFASLHIAWMEVPDPKGKIEELERERIRVYRELWLEVSRHRNDAGEEKKVNAYEQAAEKTTSLAKQKRKLTDGEISYYSRDPYANLQIRFSDAVAGNASKNYPDRTQPGQALRAAQKKLADANYEFKRAGTRNDPARRR